MPDRAAPVDARSRRLDGPWRATVADEELRRLYPDNDYDDGGWTAVAVPHHWRSAAAFADTDGPLLYRTRFETPAPFGAGAERDDEADEPRRTWLTLEGVFYTSDVWLDGSYLGDTEGYFFPHSFEVTDALQGQHEHTLALEVSCRPETDRPAKRNLTGTFQHDDEMDGTWNPGGIWRPVRLEQTGPVRITHFRALCRDATAEAATIFVRAVLDTVQARTVTIESTVTRAAERGSEPSTARTAEAGEPAATLRTTHPLATGENRLEWTIEVPEPDLWWPHALGDQPLYDVHVQVHTGVAPGDEGTTTGPVLLSDERRRRLGLRTVTMRDWIFSVNGERLFLKGANHGPAKQALADATAADHRRDVGLARDANLDFLRIRGHVAPPELYEAADAAGVLVWQDMPLQWGYHRSIRKQARRQARELVDLLAHHPSVFVWCGHSEPLALDIGPENIGDPAARRAFTVRALVGQQLPAWNKSVLDTSVKRVLEKSDGSRPVVAHSGVLPHLPQLDGTDSHTWFGWRHGDAQSFSRAMRLWPRLARFVSEFGAQAVPEAAEFLDPDRWPDLDWERAARVHGMQTAVLRDRVPPAQHDSFAGWRAATQQHQAQLLRTHIEALRRLKYTPTGGFALRSFADGRPAVTTAILDVDRVPKLGHAAVVAACRPIIVVADMPEAVRAGDLRPIAVHVVSDARISHSDMVVTAHLSWGEHGSPAAHHEWRWQGDLAADSCTFVATVPVVVPDQPGSLVLDLELRPAGAGDDAAAASAVSAAVGATVDEGRDRRRAGGANGFPVRNRYTSAILPR